MPRYIDMHLLYLSTRRCLIVDRHSPVKNTRKLNKETGERQSGVTQDARPKVLELFIEILLVHVLNHQKLTVDICIANQLLTVRIKLKVLDRIYLGL